MTEPPLHWGAQALWQQLEPLLPGLSVEVVRRVNSTNTALLERARALATAHPDAADARVRRSVEGAAFGRRAVDLQPRLLVAEQQSAGRGRQGRTWQSAPGASLTFSLALPLAAPDWAGLSLAVGVALCDALDALDDPDAPGPHLGLKWPNDLWLVDAAPAGRGAGRKLGGILIETVPAGLQWLVVVGIGLNVAEFDPADAASGFAALCELDPAVSSAPAVLARVALPLVHALQRFERDGFAAFAAGFATRDVLRDRAVRTTSPGLPDGIARGVSAHGALRVQAAAGIVEVSSGEVSVRPALDAPAGA